MGDRAFEIPLASTETTRLGAEVDYLIETSDLDPEPAFVTGFPVGRDEPARDCGVDAGRSNTYGPELRARHEKALTGQFVDVELRSLLKACSLSRSRHSGLRRFVGIGVWADVLFCVRVVRLDLPFSSHWPTSPTPRHASEGFAGKLTFGRGSIRLRLNSGMKLNFKLTGGKLLIEIPRETVKLSRYPLRANFLKLNEKRIPALGTIALWRNFNAENGRQ